MDDSALAAWYHEHKDDPDFLDNFEVVPPPKRSRGRPSRNMGARISVRFTPEEMEAIRATSKKEGLTYSEVVRRAVNEQSRKAARPSA
jgi:hypothetical protein